METRNIIKSGPSSFVVSLPLGWIKANRLDKGDFLYLEESENKVIYSTKNVADEESKTIRINIDNKPDGQIERLLKSAYIKNYNTFILEGASVKDRVKNIRQLINQLVAVEIMEQSSGKVVAHEMLDKKKNSPEKIIRRMDMILRSIFEDMIESIGRQNIHHYIVERELDLNRLQMLGQRLVINALENPAFMTELGEKSSGIMMENKTINYLEMIGDSLEKCAKIADKVKKDEKIIDLFSSLNKMYLEVMESYFKNDSDMAIELSIEANKQQDHVYEIQNENKNIVVIQLTTPLSDILMLIDEIALIVLNKNT